MSKINVLIAGSTGYIGIELVRILYKHKNVSIKYLCGKTSVGKDISFYDSLLEDKKIRGIITVNNLNNLFDFGYHTKKINVIFNRLLK